MDDALAGFVDRSFELDTAALALLRGRVANPAWLSELSAHTLAQRSRQRNISELAGLIAGERDGVNASVAEWVVPNDNDGPSRLEGALAAVREALRHPTTGSNLAIGEWSRGDVTRWATHPTVLPDGSRHYSHRGARLWEAPERLHVAMAVLSRGIELAYGFRPRDTQLATLFLLAHQGPADIRPGRLAQVATGEGKSIITAGVAVLKAMGGFTVDVITTSKVLAVRDAREHAGLFGMFGLHVTNNCDDACEQGEGELSADEVRRGRYLNDEAPTAVIYGEVGAFERDQLLTELHQGEPDRQVVDASRRDPSRRFALVDEVDGLLLDQASTVLYLSHEMESLRQLEPLFVRIWEVVNSVVPEGAYAGDDDAVGAVVEAVRGLLQSGELKLSGYAAPGASYTQVPYMKVEKIVEQRLSGWVRSAIQARVLRLKREYIVVNGKNPAVVVMDRGTGVEQAAVKWSHGLHQFLQLKHGLELSPESFKAVFLSNRAFFKQYGPRLVGLTGTLGSELEQSCLSTMFGVECFKMPRAFGEKYIQKAAEVAADASSWCDAIQEAAIVQRGKGRATLVVCDTIEDVLFLGAALRGSFPELHTYISAHQQLPFLDPESPRPVRPGDLIIATNLAGRGTDMKTSRDLEEAGGLHVIQSYLPANVRIQEQASGRTARGTHQGSGQFIICDASQRPIDELCRLRDLAERQRIERVLERDVRRIDCEDDLRTGFVHLGERLGGFSALLGAVVHRLSAAGQPDYYVQAQTASLMNRWACWLDSIDSRLNLVHVTGRNAIAAAYKDFERGVHRDLAGGWEGLIVEPSEWLKLGGAYRRDQRWREAERCYEHAAADPDYAIARYYRALCQLTHTPTTDPKVKGAFRADAKAAARSVEGKLQFFQESQQTVSRLAAETRARGDQDFGEPFTQRATEKLQVWSIFLSAIQEALGTELTPGALKGSHRIWDGAHAQQVIDRLVEASLCKPLRVSRKFKLMGSTFSQNGQDILGLRRFAPITAELSRVLQPGRAITQEDLRQATRSLMTQEGARAALEARSIARHHLRLKPIPAIWPGWDDAQLPVAVRSALSKRYARAREALRPSDTLERLEQCLQQPEGEAGEADGAGEPTQEDRGKFLKALKDRGVVSEDVLLDLTPTLGAEPSSFADYTSAREAIARAFAGLDDTIVAALGGALIERRDPEPAAAEDAQPMPPVPRYGLRREVQLSDLSLPRSAEQAADVLWGSLSQSGVLKAARLTLPSDRDLKEHFHAIRRVLRQRCELGGEHMDEAVRSVFAVLEGTVGMLRTLDGRKVTIRFAEVARAYFMDQGKHIPAALQEFVEAGLDVVGSLIEKKDPPSWWQVAAVVVMGMAQIVGGTIIKTIIPVMGELVGNILINTGMDDIVFGVTSALTGEFSWQAYWSAKQSSLVSAVKSAAVVSAGSVAARVAQGGVGRAYRLQQVSQLERLQLAGRVPSNASFNIASHVAKEVGRTLVDSCVSQVASRGVQAVVEEVTGAYAGNLESRVRASVAQRWPAVAKQARTLYDKLGGDRSVQGAIDGCMQEVLDKASRERAFTSLVRTSKPAIGIAASSMANGGWSTLITAGADVANLGVSGKRIWDLTETEVSKLARTIRETKDHKSAATTAEGRAEDREEFERFLSVKEDQFSRGLAGIINTLLQSSVYSPLVGYGVQLAASKVASSLIPRTEIERRAQSDDFVESTMAHEADPNAAYYDAPLRRDRGADIEVDLDALPADRQDELRSQVVEGTNGRTLGQLESEYQGCPLKVYRDGQHNLYVQRPVLSEYNQGIRNGKPVGDAEIIAEAQLNNKPILLKDRKNGAVRTYYPDGHIDDITPANAITLDYTAGKDGGLAHITAAGTTSTPGAEALPGTDCFYVALLQATGPAEGLIVDEKMIVDARMKVANHMDTDRHCQLFYKNWSMNGKVKEFAGSWLPTGKPSDLADAYDNFVAGIYNERINSLLVNPSFLNHMGSIGMLSALELGRSPANVLRFGSGVKEGTFAGLATDTLRLAGLAGLAGSLGVGAKTFSQVARSERVAGLFFSAKVKFRRHISSVQRTKWSIENVQDTYPLTNIPRRFDWHINRKVIRVKPNATKHINEYVLPRVGRPGNGAGPFSSLASAVEEGLKRSTKKVGRHSRSVEEWELGFERMKDGTLELYHAVPKWKGRAK